MPHAPALDARTWTMLLGLALIWGGSFLAYAIVLDELPVFITVAHRVLWAAVALGLYCLWRGIPLPRGARVWGACFVMGLLNNAIPFSLIAFGQTQIESGLAAILNASTALFGVLLAALFFADERLSARRLFGVLLGFSGVIVVMGLDTLGGFDLRAIGQLALIGSSISYGFAAVWARKTMGGLDPEASAFGMLTCSTLVMVPLALVLDGPPRFDLALSTVVAMLHLSLVATAGAYFLYYRLLRRAGSGNLLLVTLLVAPIAVLAGALVRAESLPPTALAGFGLLALGLLVIDGRILRWVRL